jgi:DNA-binding winged helix-turn-helix (wHTH) protein/alpha-beta hydrolase superfamily lysophospholipase
VLELRVDGAPTSLEPQVFSVLAYLVEHRDRVVSKDELLEQVWETRYVSDAALASRIMAARRAVGDDGRAQRLIKTVQRRGYRFIGNVEEAASAGAAPLDIAGKEAAAPSVRPVGTTSIQFCTTPDEIRIAYAVAGSGPPFVKVANWLTHLEFDLESPIWRHLITDLVPDRQFIRYDARGSGLSDWDVEELSLDGWVRDLEAVIDELGLDRFPLLGISQGGAIAVEYAVRNPGRVSHLVVQGGYARGRRARGQEQRAASAALESLTEQGWGRPESSFARLFSDRMIPGGTAQQQNWLTDLQRVSTSPANALRFMTATGAVDVVDRLSQVDVPTLVLHSRDEEQVPFEEGRILAAGIRDARLVPLESRNHLILEAEPAWLLYRDEVRAFLDTSE